MNPDFIDRTIKTSAIVSLIFLPFLTLYVSPAYGLGVVAGALWGCANLFLLKRLVLAYITTSKRGVKELIILGLLKLPVLYGIGFLILYSGLFPVTSVVIGFTGIFPVMVLKAVGRQLVENASSVDRTEVPSISGRE